MGIVVYIEHIFGYCMGVKGLECVTFWSSEYCTVILKKAL
jgi:hypothetical protein